MTIDRGFDGSEPIEHRSGAHDERLTARTRHLATGTLACPECDAPVAPGATPLRPADVLACPYCLHAAAVRDFLSLADPSRPARVAVRVVMPAML